MALAVFSVTAVHAADKGRKEVAGKETGIQFMEASWASILKKAKAEKKVIFFDAYTTWCGPCKMLQKNVFTRTDVADVFNKNFINVKFDMESGEGPALAAKYPLEGYPTLFFIDPDGKIVRQVIGYQRPEELIKIAKSIKKVPGA
ncbi:thioredoxin family protein [Dyadobacter sandarakinus]|uniref:Thioredoxin family protein n=1 Tax=Dyadobacter sandarakinus TaxID=2747268 RepID=A0ABX7I9V0_9BACT|nr:thioredoxin fold domain-containing protein [Dyadobacter sandarakinus]QRR02685.1 thioredoxin family protein [Dyadobacter sandarakinus]